MTFSWRKDRVKLFWAFVAERHRMFLRRVVLKQPPPWTADRYLAHAYYTNVYRELDRVTRHLVDHVLVPSADEQCEDRLFNVILYRVFNWPATYERLGGYKPAKAWDLALVRRRLIRTADKVFTGAFMVNAAQRGGAKYRGPGGKITLWCDRLRWVQQHAQVLRNNMSLGMDGSSRENMREAHRQLAEIPGVGAFLAYEMLIDCTYTETPVLPEYHEDDWVNAGPGAKKGLAFLLRQLPRRREEWEDAIGWLRHVSQLGGQPPAPTHGPELTLRNVEHSLCEFSKYMRLRDGIRPKRTYRAINPDLSPWAALPSIYAQHLETL